MRLLHAVSIVIPLILHAAVFAQDAPAHDSPRAAMMSFLDAVNRVERREGDENAAWAQALAALDTTGVGPDAAKQAARQLNEVLDKLGEIVPADLPDAVMVASENVARFTFFPQAAKFDWLYEKLKQFGRWPDGRIVLERQADGGWRFNAETMATIGTLAESMAPLPPVFVEPARQREPHPVVRVVGRTFHDTAWWEWGALAAFIFLGLLAGRLSSHGLRLAGDRWTGRRWAVRGTILHDLASPLSLALFTIGILVGLSFIRIDAQVRAAFVTPVLKLLFLIAAGWFAYNLIDVVEHALRRVAGTSESKLDDMLVPLVRKTLRVFLVIVFALVAAENVFNMDVTGFLAGLGIAGLAVSLAAQDSVKNLFGSLTVLFDKPFFVGDAITFDGQTGTVEEIGFRSTRIRLGMGHLVTVPNMKFIDSKVENLSARPGILRDLTVTIARDTPAEKVQRAVEIFRQVLSDPRVADRFDLEKRPPRVNFTDFTPDGLNIKGVYWYINPPPGDRAALAYPDHAELVNLLLFERYAEAGIALAFPTRTLHVADGVLKR